jgi:type IV secretory pathway VirB3-like protein
MSISVEQEIETHTIQLADTRPTMIGIPFLGEIPIVLGALVFAIFGCAYVLFGWKWALGFPAVWFGVSRLIALDYHAITKFDLWRNTSAWNLDTKTHGGNSVTPFPLYPKRPKGMR